MRILFGSWPGYGHLLPMVPMIRAAQHGGHDVVVSSGADMSALIGRLGVAAHRSGVTLDESYDRMPGQATISELPAEQQPGFAARHLFGAGAVDRAHDLLDLLQRWRPDLIVHDTLELGSPTAAALHGIPHVTHGYGPMVPNTSYFAAAIGAALSDAGLPHPDTVYLTLGTIMNQTPKVFRAVIDGCARWPVNLVVTTGPGFDSALLGPLPPAVRTAPFLPQAAVLRHCRAVVSHAGAGTMLGALCYGLPQLCLPQGTDQPSNTAALLPTGAALALPRDEITADAVAEALGQLLNEPSFRQAANRLRAEIERMPTAAAVLDEVLVTTGQ